MIGAIDIAGLNEANENSVISDFVDFKFYTSEYGIYDESTLLGEVVFLPDENSEELVAYIEYADGSTELLSEVLNGLFGQMEGLM